MHGRFQAEVIAGAEALQLEIARSARSAGPVHLGVEWLDGQAKRRKWWWGQGVGSADIEARLRSGALFPGPWGAKEDV